MSFEEFERDGASPLTDSGVEAPGPESAAPAEPGAAPELKYTGSTNEAPPAYGPRL